MKRSLPTLQQRKRSARASRASTPVPAQRLDPRRAVLAVAPEGVDSGAGRFCVELLRGFSSIGLGVAALVTVDSPDLAPEAQAAFAGLSDAGARQVKLIKATGDVGQSLTDALSTFPPDAVVVAFGQTLPLWMRPVFCVVVAAHARAAGSGREAQLVHQADLLLFDPSVDLADELARALAPRLREFRAS